VLASRQRRRRRNRRWAIALGLLVVAATLYQRRAPDDAQELTSTPGFSDTATTLSSKPFDFGLIDGGATTLPESYFGDRTTSTLPTTTAPPTTTTTSQPPLYLPTKIDSICGLNRSLISLFPDGKVSDARIANILGRLNANLDRYLELAPPEMLEDLRAVRQLVRELTALFEEGGRSADYPPLAARVESLSQGKPPDQDVALRFRRLALQEAAFCDE
jgi:hypothetical protein